MSTSKATLKSSIDDRIGKAHASAIWTPIDFVDLGSRDAIDKTLQRLVHSGYLQRIDRGLYTQIHTNPLTGKPAAPDYQKVIEAVSRREQIRVLVDGMSAANALGLTNAVPGQVIVHTDGRLRPIQVGNLTIQFKLTAPSKLYWAGHPAMQIIQALYWLHSSLKKDDTELQNTESKLIRVLLTPHSGKKICHDLLNGLHTVPTWMQVWIRKLISLSRTSRRNTQR